jgi:RNA polymerase sigma factor (sigma-70 family)
MRFTDAQAALHSRPGKSLARRRELGHQHPISCKDLIAIIWRDHRSHGLVMRKDGVAWAKGVQRTPHSPAPVERRWRYVLGAPDRALLKFDPPSPPAGDIPECPTMSRKKFPKLYQSGRYGEGAKTVLVYGARGPLGDPVWVSTQRRMVKVGPHQYRSGVAGPLAYIVEDRTLQRVDGGRIIEPPIERQAAQFARGAPRWKPGPKQIKKPEYAQRPWRVRLAAPSTPETQITLRFEPWPMTRAHTDVLGDGFRVVRPIPVLMRDELGAGFHVIRTIGMEHPWIIRAPGKRAIYSAEAWAVLWALWDATPKPPYVRQIWAVTGPAGKVIKHRVLGEIFETHPSGAMEEHYLGRNTTVDDKEEYSPHGDRPFRPGYQLRQWERARAEESTRRSDYRRWLLVIRRALRQERLDHGHLFEQRRLTDLRALFREHELLVHPELDALTHPHRRYAYVGGPLDRDLERWVTAIARRVRRHWGKPLRRRLHEWDIDDLVQEGWLAAVKAQRQFSPERDKWKAYSAIAISRALWTWLRWQASATTISLNPTTYKHDREAGLLREAVELDSEIRMVPLLRSRPAYEVFGDDDRLDHQDRGTPNWREIAALLGGIEGAKKRARLVLDSFELTIMLKRLEGMALQEIATKLKLPVSTVHDIERRAARRMLKKIDPIMTMIDFTFTLAARKNTSRSRMPN